MHCLTLLSVSKETQRALTPAEEVMEAWYYAKHE
jgi:hypothetical protein